MDGREAWHIISLLGVWGNRISFLSQIKMMRHAGMNNFMAIDIHTLTNRKSYGHVGNDFISEKKNKNEEFHSNYVLCRSDCWCWIKIYNGLVKVIVMYTFHPFSKLLILFRFTGAWHYLIIAWIAHVSLHLILRMFNSRHVFGLRNHKPKGKPHKQRTCEQNLINEVTVLTTEHQLQ